MPHPNPKTKSKDNDKQKKRNINVVTWNIRRGLITKENELTILLDSEDFDVIFLTETDTCVQNAKDYKIKNYDKNCSHL